MSADARKRDPDATTDTATERFRLAWLSARRRADRWRFNYHAAESVLRHAGIIHDHATTDAATPCVNHGPLQMASAPCTCAAPVDATRGGHVTPRSALSYALVGENPYDRAAYALERLAAIGWTVAPVAEVAS